MTTKYFRNFNLVNYRFGDNEAPVLFDNITQYVDIIDQIKDQVSFYNRYTIVSGERPDTLSYELYGTTDYYWTFYFLNDHIREQGWPIPDYELLAQAQIKYPYRTVTTETDISSSFKIGTTVTGTQSGTTGVVVRRRLDLGQLIINTGGDNFNTLAQNNEFISYIDTDGTFYSAGVLKESAQYDSVHHYEDVNGNYVDIDPYDQANLSSSYIPITWRNRLEEENGKLKEIIVLRPEVIDRIVGEFNKLHKQG